MLLLCRRRKAFSEEPLLRACMFACESRMSPARFLSRGCRPFDSQRSAYLRKLLPEQAALRLPTFETSKPLPVNFSFPYCVFRFLICNFALL